MTLLVIIQILLFVWFPVFMWIREGHILSSISASTYRLRGNEKGLFTFWLVGMALSMLGLIALDVMPIWAGLMAIGFAVTGMSPDHRTNPNSLEDGFHTAGTILAIVAGFGGLWFVYGMWIHFAIFVAGSAAFFLVRKNWIWWVECWAMATIAMGLLSV